jgi:crotonobetainyl-CoA:carnitine CoA-transferase CaiB-like acyl-CoA transferase
MHYDRPYADLKVLDMSQGVAGPYCGSLLALHGAQVIKLEPPDGDWVRKLGTRHGDQSVLAVCSNRGKRSIAVDLKAAAGLEIARKLAHDADIVIEGFRAGVAERLGVGYDAVRAGNPRVIYVSVSGYGQTSPYRHQACTDSVVQAFSGLMSVNRGRDGAPHRVRFLLVDMVSGLYAFQAVAPALYARERLGEGRHIDIALTQSIAAIQGATITEFALAAGEPPALNAPAGTYRTADGWIVVTLVTESHFGAICEALELGHLRNDPRYETFESRAQHLDTLVEIIQERLLSAGTEQWCRRFLDAGALAQGINDYGDWLADEHVRETDASPSVTQPGVGDLPMVRIPGMLPIPAGDDRSHAPAVGQHGREILQQYGYTSGVIEELLRSGVVRE